MQNNFISEGYHESDSAECSYKMVILTPPNVLNGCSILEARGCSRPTADKQRSLFGSELHDQPSSIMDMMGESLKGKECIYIVPDMSTIQLYFIRGLLKLLSSANE